MIEALFLEVKRELEVPNFGKVNSLFSRFREDKPDGLSWPIAQLPQTLSSFVELWLDN